MFQLLRSRMGKIWCSLAHDSLMWPVHRHCSCRTCGRRYPAFAQPPAARWTKRAVLKLAVPLMIAVVLTSIAHTANASNAMKGHAVPGAEAALERYLARGEYAPWTLAAVEIHAALSKTGQAGQLWAVRSQESAGESRYQVLQQAGDRTVRDLLIARYLHLEEHDAATPAAAVAVTPANYRISYKGAVDDGERQAYVFRITPRRKRLGLIEGELWIDQKTGVPILRTGRLVKSPLSFVRRVTITQENAFCDGVIESRLTHLKVDTRLSGRAELVIEERPVVSLDAARLAISVGEGGPQ